MTLQRFEIVGFVIDREELVSEFEWNKFLVTKSIWIVIIWNYAV